MVVAQSKFQHSRKLSQKRWNGSRQGVPTEIEFELLVTGQETKLGQEGTCEVIVVQIKLKGCHRKTRRVRTRKEETDTLGHASLAGKEGTCLVQDGQLSKFRRDLTDKIASVCIQPCHGCQETQL